MPTERRVNVLPLIILSVLVCAAGAAVGAFFGNLASLMYGGFYIPSPGSPPPPSPDHEIIVQVAIWWGAATGLLAGIVWCRIMIRETIRGLVNSPASRGAWLGVRVGVLSALLLHAGLIIAWLILWPGKLDTDNLYDHAYSGFMNTLVGVLFGTVAGFIVGMLCGAAWLLAMRLANVGDRSVHPESGE